VSVSAKRGPDVVALEPFLGEVLSQALNRSHVSDTEIARRAGLSRTYIRQLKGGKASPSLRTLSAIGAALGVEASKLVRQSELLRDGRSIWPFD
jgi:transcriptional regulator with XRE-family HTH domain